MSSRLARRRLEDQSWTWSPVAAAAVALVTVPETVTLALGVANVGLTDVIAIDIGGSAAACAWPGLPPLAAAGTAERAAAATPAASARSRTAAPCPG
jgi:hypothetical protein